MKKIALISLISMIAIVVFMEGFLRVAAKKQWNFASPKTQAGQVDVVKAAPPFDHNPYTIVYNRPNLRTEHYTTNSLGFRDEREISVTKPEGMKRIFVIGGSQAIGYNASHNDATIAGQLEPLLKQKWGENLEVINAACSGFTSLQELILFQREILRYQPDLVIALGGGSDFAVSTIPQWTPGWHELYSLAESRMTHPFWEHSYLAKAISNKFPKPRAVKPNAKISHEAVQFYVSNVQSLVNMASARGISLMVVMTAAPFLSPKTLTEKEKAFVSRIETESDLPSGYVEAMRKLYRMAQEEIAKVPFPKKTLFYNAGDAFTNETRQVFSDRTHLNDLGNTLVAEKLSQLIDKNGLLSSTMRLTRSN